MTELYPYAGVLVYKIMMVTSDNVNGQYQRDFQ